VIRAVIDTNALVSAAIKPRGEAGRDDNMFLEVALSGLADYVVSNDGDLLTLSPFEGIPIITPPLFLQQLDGDL
jgi:predicted nucleic acid-binding protein